MTADRLATPEDLASLLQRADLDMSTAGLLVEIGTAVVQAATGQRIVFVAGDTFEVMGTHDQWLDLPQIPVTAASGVTIDGTAVTEGTGWGQWRRFGNRLYRSCGWRHGCPGPSLVAGVNDHGYADGRQELQLGRGAVLSICKGVYGNPKGAASEAIDDYRVSYEALATQLEASPNLIAALRRQYGRRATAVRVG